MSPRLFACVALAFATTLAARAGDFSPPLTRTQDLATDYYGSWVADPYRWLEQGDSPAVRAWFRQQNDYARAVLDGIPGRVALRERIAQLGAAGEQLGRIQLRDDRIFYLKQGPADNRFKLYVRSGLGKENDTERLLIDPARFDAGDLHAAIDYYHASPNGRYVAYGVSLGGSEKSVLRVFDVAQLRDAGQSIAGASLDDNGEYPGFSWHMNSRSFLYNQLRELDPRDSVRATYEDSVTRLRILNDDGAPTIDLPVLSRLLQPAMQLARDDVPMIRVSPISSFAIAVIKHGEQNELTLYAAPLIELKGANTPWKLIADSTQSITAIDLRGDYLYVLSHDEAPRFKILRLSLSQALQAQSSTAQPAAIWTQSQIVVPAGERVLTGLAIAQDALYVRALDNGTDRLMRLQFNVRPAKVVRRAKAAKRSRHAKAPAKKTAGIAARHDIALPFAGSISELVTDPLQAGALIKLTSWTESPRVYRVNGKTGKVEATALLAASPVDFRGVTATLVNVPSHDGTPIPLSIIHTRGLKLDRRNPTLLSGYGAYGLRSDPSFAPQLLAWLEQGGVFAVAHVRGGGENGEAWHRAGQKLSKPNTWKDFIACAEYLIASGYTDRAHLAGAGASAGGILIGRAITERPDLFAAAISDVGMSDALRFERSANGPPNVPEFGSVETAEGFKALYEMSAYHHVDNGVAYPAVLLTTGINDPRVDAWQPGKMAARLQAASTSGKPVLLSVDFVGGHGDQPDERLTDRFAFSFWQLGVKDFQPAP